MMRLELFGAWDSGEGLGKRRASVRARRADHPLVLGANGQGESAGVDGPYGTFKARDSGEGLALDKDGWVTHTVKTAGRGGKGGLIAATDKLLKVDFELLLGFRPGDLPADLRAVMTTPLAKIHKDLQSSSTHVKGIALELLAVNLASDLGLTPLRLRVRGVQTGGAEVDLVAEGAHLLFSRWLFQCKNTKSVHVDVLAKEVGMARLLQSHVIVIATTGSFSKTVRTYAERLSETTPFQVVLVDGDVMRNHRDNGALALREILHRDAEKAMRLKRPQVLETLEELGEDSSSS